MAKDELEGEMSERLETFGFQRREEINTEKHNREQGHKSKNITRKMWQNVCLSSSPFLVSYPPEVSSHGAVRIHVLLSGFGKY